jgi:endonuclease III
LLVGFGQVRFHYISLSLNIFITTAQTVCLPVGPRCDTCDLSSTGLCPSARKGAKSKHRRTVLSTAESSEAKIEIVLESSEQSESTASALV